MNRWQAVTAMGLLALTASLGTARAQDNAIVHDAEHYVLQAQNGERWTKEDTEISAKLAEIRK